MWEEEPKKGSQWWCSEWRRLAAKVAASLTVGVDEFDREDREVWSGLPDTVHGPNHSLSKRLDHDRERLVLCPEVLISSDSDGEVPARRNHTGCLP